MANVTLTSHAIRNALQRIATKEQRQRAALETTQAERAVWEQLLKDTEKGTK